MLKRFKNLVSLVLVFSLVLSTILLFSSLPVNAGNQSLNDNGLNETEYSILNTLNDMGLSGEFFLLESRESLSSGQNSDLLEFDSIEEFVLFVEYVLDLIREPKVFYIDIGHNDNGYIAAIPFGQGEHIFNILSWWAPLPPLGLTWMNMSYSFMFHPSQVPGVRNLRVEDTWLTGLQVGVSWTHRFGNVRQISSVDRRHVAEMSATGTLFFGISIFGVPIGHSSNHTIGGTLTLTW